MTEQLPSAEAAPESPQPVDDMKLWLWKNVDHFLAYAHEYPTYDGGDPMTLGEPAAWAIFKTSSPPSTVGTHANAPSERAQPLIEKYADYLPTGALEVQFGDDVRAVLSAAASERQAALLARLREPDVREAVKRALEPYFHDAITIQARDDAAAAVIAFIVGKMLK